MMAACGNQVAEEVEAKSQARAAVQKAKWQ